MTPQLEGDREGVPFSGQTPGLIWKRGDWAWLGAIFLVVILAWSFAYNRWTASAWETPLVYGSDGWATMASAKAFTSEGVWPLLPKYPRSLGAPFRANWNDHLTVEEPIFLWHGMLARFFGLGLGANLAVVTAHLLAAAAFFFTARQLGSNRAFASVCAILFALSPFAFARGLTHLILLYHWHIPLGLLVVWWCLDRKQWSRRSILAALLIGVAHGVQNPYYTSIFLQLVGLAALVLLVRRAPLRTILVPVLICAATIASFLVMNLDSIASRIANGPNLLANARSYAGVELYALKPLELLLPVGHHSPWLSDLVRRAYVDKVLFFGELPSPYLGIVSIAGLAALLWTAARGFIGRLTPIPRHFYIILWLVAYSVVGGLNGLIGIFGFVLFRATNRFSIAIMAVILLFVSTTLTRRTNGWRSLHKFALVLAILGIGLWDQLRETTSLNTINAARDEVASDARFAAAIEKQLRPGAMVFQLPVMPYPESDKIGKMGDYEHFRPYLFTRGLHYSYGSDKGRTRERWQAEAAALGAPGIIAMTERYGFSAIFLNKKGYADGGGALLDSFRALGRGTVVADSPDLVCVALNPAAEPALPPDFDRHWHYLEGTIDANWRWSEGSASVVLYQNNPAPRNIRVTFRLASAGPRSIAISHCGAELYRRDFRAGDSPADVTLDVPVDAESATLQFVTDRPGELPGNGDPQRLAFNVRDFKVTQ